METMPGMAPNGTIEVFSRLIQTLPTFWVERIWILIFSFLVLGSQISGFPGPQISKFPEFQVPRSPNSQISRFPDFQTPPAAPPPDEFSDPNLTPLPAHPGIKYVARSPCCD